MFSKKTKKLGLPQWLPKDHPDFLTDMNDAYKTIDEQFEQQELTNSSNNNELTNMKQQYTVLSLEVDSNEKRIDSLESTAETIGNRITDIEQKNVEQDEKINNTWEKIEVIFYFTLEPGTYTAGQRYPVFGWDKSALDEESYEYYLPALCGAYWRNPRELSLIDYFYDQQNSHFYPITECVEEKENAVKFTINGLRRKRNNVKRNISTANMSNTPFISARVSPRIEGND